MQPRNSTWKRKCLKLDTTRSLKAYFRTVISRYLAILTQNNRGIYSINIRYLFNQRTKLKHLLTHLQEGYVLYIRSCP